MENHLPNVMFIFAYDYHLETSSRIRTLRDQREYGFVLFRITGKSVFFIYNYYTYRYHHLKETLRRFQVLYLLRGSCSTANRFFWNNKNNKINFRYKIYHKSQAILKEVGNTYKKNSLYIPGVKVDFAVVRGRRCGQQQIIVIARVESVRRIVWHRVSA